MCEEDSDDSEAVAKLLEINDSIHRTVERYKLIKKGDVDAAAKIPKGTLGTSTGVGKNAANQLSLIDFDPESSQQTDTEQVSGAGGSTGVENDLLGLSMDDKPSSQAGGISLGFGSNFGVPGPPLLSSTMGQNDSEPISKPTFSQAHVRAPDYAPKASSELNAFPGMMSAPADQGQQRAAHVSAVPSVAVDPFAALVAAGSRSSSPLNRQGLAKPKSTASSLLDLTESLSLANPTSTPPPPPAGSEGHGKSGLGMDDEWSFASSLPESTLPSSHRLEVHSSFIRIEFFATRLASQTSIQIVARFSNNTRKAVRALHFQVAVERVGEHPDFDKPAFLSFFPSSTF
jgi:ADP-ribosylation factor-binding protein GGA